MSFVRRPEWHWSNDGCSLVSYNRTHTVCKCNHLTGFANLMDFHNYTVNLSVESNKNKSTDVRFFRSTFRDCRWVWKWRVWCAVRYQWSPWLPPWSCWVSSSECCNIVSHDLSMISFHCDINRWSLITLVTWTQRFVWWAGQSKTIGPLSRRTCAVLWCSATSSSWPLWIKITSSWTT